MLCVLHECLFTFGRGYMLCLVRAIVIWVCVTYCGGVWVFVYGVYNIPIIDGVLCGIL